MRGFPAALIIAALPTLTVTASRRAAEPPGEGSHAQILFLQGCALGHASGRAGGVTGSPRPLLVAMMGRPH